MAIDSAKPTLSYGWPRDIAARLIIATSVAPVSFDVRSPAFRVSWAFSKAHSDFVKIYHTASGDTLNEWAIVCPCYNERLNPTLFARLGEGPVEILVNQRDSTF
jgi:hypothetical protein